jgi:hypothetical protein
MGLSVQPFARQNPPRRSRNSCFTIVDFGLCQRIRIRRFGRTAYGGGRAVIPLSCVCPPSPSSHPLPTSPLFPNYLSVQNLPRSPGGVKRGGGRGMATPRIKYNSSHASPPSHKPGTNNPLFEEEGLGDAGLPDHWSAWGIFTHASGWDNADPRKGE